MKIELAKSASQLKSASLVALFALAPVLAQAHPGHGPASGFMSGLNHPLHGLDHILAMVAVGLWAAQLGGRSLWAVPATFVSVMILGGALGMMGVPLPMVETGILLSVLALGLLIAAAARLPLAASMVIVGLFALFHGHAHGTEIPLAASGLSYGFGFVAATTLLHTAGIGLGLAAQKLASARAIRYAGAAIALCGLCLWLG
jgi:urease accessory protein